MPTRFHFVHALALLLTASAAGCGDDGPAGPDNFGLGTLSADIDGVTWTAVSATAASSTNDIVGVGAADLSGTSIAFAFSNQPGSYTIGPTNVYNAQYNETQGSTVSAWLASGLQGGSGTITVTSITADRVQGTFEFVAVPVNQPGAPNVVVTNGVFDVPLD